MVRSNTYFQYFASKGVDLNARNNAFDQPIHAQTGAHCYRAVKALIELGASPNSLNAQNQTPLHLTNSINIATILLESGANLEIADKVSLSNVVIERMGCFQYTWQLQN